MNSGSPTQAHGAWESCRLPPLFPGIKGWISLGEQRLKHNGGGPALNIPSLLFCSTPCQENPRLLLPSSNHSSTGVKPSLNAVSTRRSLPCVCHREATALADAFIHQQLSEEARRVPGRAARRNLWRRGSVPGQLGQLQLQVHLLLESPDVNLGLGSGELPGRLPGRHRRSAGRAASAQGWPRENIPRAGKGEMPPLIHQANPAWSSIYGRRIRQRCHKAPALPGFPGKMHPVLLWPRS